MICLNPNCKREFTPFYFGTLAASKSNTLCPRCVKEDLKPNYRIFFCPPTAKKPAGDFTVCEYNLDTHITIIAYPCAKRDPAYPVRDAAENIIYFNRGPRPIFP